MKKLIYSACVGTMAMALSAYAVDNDGLSHKGKRQNATTTQSTSVKTTGVSTQANVRRNGNVNRSQQRSVAITRSNHNAAVVHQNQLRSNRQNRIYTSNNMETSNTARVHRGHRNYEMGTADSTNIRVNRNRDNDHVNRNVTVNRVRNVNRAQNVQINQGRNVDRTRNVNRTRNVVVTNNWRGDRFNGQQYGAFRNYHRQWHDRNWYQHNCSRITFVFGAPYYWNTGYWYPAWGYNPGYSYIYDGPIYGYNNLSPDQVVVNVQAQLQRDGYYSGPVDGQLGPMTRQAIADFQADRGLAVTAAVDEPTLASLGLV